MKNYLFYFFLFIAGGLFAQEIAYQYDDAGNRTARIITLFGSLRSSEMPAPIDEVIAEQSIKIYPNPTEGMLAVEIINYSDEMSIDFLLLNLSGSVIEQRSTSTAYSTFNISDHPNGVYLLRITINGESKTWKIIKK